MAESQDIEFSDCIRKVGINTHLLYDKNMQEKPLSRSTDIHTRSHSN